ncbi:hypothetical protein CMO95_03555 [Candidatus Woesearchaeota archaeon]|nr:hypothetical protein [Candidatus Woesearchaeota archaeon]|tara:strand:- start:3436 stop:5298 length:1863 start_codon:yes stop_codon:yes gene_type:complete
MPKIPTYKARGQITTQAPSIQTGLQISPTATAAAKLIKPLTQVAEYYERERMIAEKADAEKQYLELSTELDEIENNAGKLFDPLEASKIFNTQANFLIKEKLGQNKNKRVKKMMSDLFDQDVIIRNNNVKKLARKELDKQEEYNFNTKYEINLSKYKLATNQTEKDFYKNQIFSNQESRSLYFNDSESTKNIAMDSINKDLLVSDVEQLIEKKQYDKAKNILENVDNTPYLDSDKRTSLLSKINDEYEKVLADANIDNLILSKSGVYVVGGELKNIDGSQIKQKDLESGMNRMTMAVNEQGNNKYSTSQVVELSIANNAAVPFYKSILVSGIANISDTGDKTLTEKGLEIYRFYKNQNGLSTLRATYNLDKETLESYSRLDFATNVLKQTFDSAFKTELDIKNKPEDYRARIIQDKKIDSKFAEIDMPGLFDPEIQNVQTVKYLLKNIANIYFKSGGTEDDALDGAVKYIEQNYRFDSFNQIVPNDNSLPEYHDASIKTYIKKIYDEGLINKEKHNLDDIYPAYFSYGDFSNQQGFVLRNRKTGEALTISASPPLGDFDERTYNSSRMTQDDVVKIIYPLIQDEKYRSWILKFNLLKDKRKKIQNLKEPVVVSGFGDPID